MPTALVEPLPARADVTASCQWCGQAVLGADAAGDLVTLAGPDCPAGPVAAPLPHDTRYALDSAQGNPDLAWFAVGLYEADMSARDEVVLGGGNPDDPESEHFLAEPTLGSAWSLWSAEDQEARQIALRISGGLDPEEVIDRVAQVGRDLALLLRHYGMDTSVSEVVPAPALA